MLINQVDYGWLAEGLTGDYQVKVSNMGRKKVCYVVEELRIRRDFAPNTNGRLDTKVISFHELYLLSNQPGGGYTIYNYLQIKDNKVRKALGLPEDPEFDYSYDDVKKIIMDGTYEEILDTIEFGPHWIRSTMKEIAVTQGVNNYQRRKELETLFSINLDAATAMIKDAAEDGKVGNLYQEMLPQAKPTRQRRAGSAQQKDEVEEKPTRTRRAPAKK